MNYFLLSWIIHFSVNSNFVENELIAGFEWNVHRTQIDLTWLVVAFLAVPRQLYRFPCH